MGAMGRHHSFWELSMKTMRAEEFAALSGKTIQTLLSLQDLILTQGGKPIAVAAAFDIAVPKTFPSKTSGQTLRWAHEISKIGQEAIKAAVDQHLKAGRSIAVLKKGWILRIGPDESNQDDL
jgi:hypothetical protein